MKFLVDGNLSTRVAAHLRMRGENAAHIRDIGLSRATDAEIAAVARRTGAAVMTQDADFIAWAGGPAHAWLQIVLIRLGNARTQEVLTALDRQWPRIASKLDFGDDLIEVKP